MVTTKALTRLEKFCENPPNGWNIHLHNEVSSSNKIAMALGIEGELDKTIVIAGNQTKGRGRLGKSWQSFAGCGLYLSIILRPKLDLSELSRITLAAGVAVAEVAAKLINEKPMLKWPNDLLIEGKKCGGILAESDVRNPNAPLVVLGVGININTPEGGYPTDLRVSPCCLTDFSDSKIFLEDVLQALVPQVHRKIKLLEQGEFKEILQAWREYDYTKGKLLNWVTTKGDIVEGISQGVNGQGLLFIKDADGDTHEVLSGDVRLV